MHKQVIHEKGRVHCSPWHLWACLWVRCSRLCPSLPFQAWASLGVVTPLCQLGCSHDPLVGSSQESFIVRQKGILWWTNQPNFYKRTNSFSLTQERKKQGVCHTVGLHHYEKLIFLPEELWEFKYFTIAKIY
jgi:hypothetical protein